MLKDASERSYCPSEYEEVYAAPLARQLPKNKKYYKLIDLFSGAGGMTLGYTPAFGNSFMPVWANDINDYAANTYNLNFGHHCIVGDIVGLLQDRKVKIPKAEVVIGGPPCQGFSLLNRNRSSDPRKQLWRPFLEVVKISRKCF